jgi:hypothetical protein
MKPALFLLLGASLAFTGCRLEAQDRPHGNGNPAAQVVADERHYITLYSLDGTVLFEGVVAGTVDQAAGSYIFWYDDQGRYHQSDLPYLLTSYRRAETPPPAAEPVMAR